jgi:hypothetical protein
LTDAAVTSAVLSDWLQRYGSLPNGEVEAVRIELQFETAFSRLTFLDATYSADAPGGLPRSLVVKRFLTPTRAVNDRSGEAAFYLRLAPREPTPALVRCVAAFEENEGTPEILILEDLRATHDHPRWPLPPSVTQSRAAIEALADFHAQWWESPALGNEIGGLHTEDSLTRMVRGIGASLPAFFDAVGDALTSEARRVLERVFSSTLRPWLRIIEPRALTVVHGDAHTWNFLFPRSGNGATFLIDWQLWHIDVGARDLAFFMALHWSPDRRRELEQTMLRSYHERIVAHHGIAYPFNELLLDYRRCVVRNLTIPILFWRRGMKPEGWWHRLEYALAAYTELECEELL